MGFQTGPEDSYGRCGGEEFRQTVPDTSSGDRKSSVVDGEQSKIYNLVTGLQFIILCRSSADILCGPPPNF